MFRHLASFLKNLGFFFTFYAIRQIASFLLVTIFHRLTPEGYTVKLAANVYSEKNSTKNKNTQHNLHFQSFGSSEKH